ncbi:MAG: hypothetical protein FWE35_21610 [Streptosporangiales bacterium]|nr:hypothetical protein [Streptosporangiales bacterium]
MYGNRWRTPALAASVLAVSAAGLTACGGSPASRVNVGSSASAGTVQQAGPITPAKLVSALLTRINGAPAAQAAAGGAYNALPQVKAIEQQARGAGVDPMPCAQGVLSAMQPGALGKAPAAVVSFKVGRNSVSEVLASPSRTAADAVLRATLPASCQHYQAAAVQYTTQAQNITGIGERARVLNVKAVGRPGGNAWSVVFRGAEFIGSVTVVGPNASELAVRELGLQAYGYAAKTLS